MKPIGPLDCCIICDSFTVEALLLSQHSIAESSADKLRYRIIAPKHPVSPTCDVKAASAIERIETRLCCLMTEAKRNDSGSENILRHNAFSALTTKSSLSVAS
jgi:hypothetical protein